VELYAYRENNQWTYSAKYIFEINNKIYLIDSNKNVLVTDIVDTDITNNGFYAMIIIDKLSDTLTAKYGQLSYCHSLYYFSADDNFYIDIHLKNLINKLENPKFNIKAVNSFVDQGFLIGEFSIIDGIKKIPALKTLINNELVNSKYITTKSSAISYTDALSKELNNVDEICLSLSGGYDSTFLAYLLKDCKNKVAIAIGKDGWKQSELEIAKNTAKLLNYKSEIISLPDDWIDILPRIVEIYEGEIIDPGLFVRFAILDRIKELNLDNYTLITGDGANQLRNWKFYNTSLTGVTEAASNRPYFLRTNPLAFFYGLVTKQMEWLAHETNVNYIAPFISLEFFEYSKINIDNDYKTFVKTSLPAQLSKNIVEHGGLVTEDNFTDAEIRRLFNKIIEQYPIFFNSRLDTRSLIYKMYIIIFDYLFIQKKTINNNFKEWLYQLAKEI